MIFPSFHIASSIRCSGNACIVSTARAMDYTSIQIHSGDPGKQMFDSSVSLSFLHWFVGQTHFHLLDEVEIVFWIALKNVLSQSLWIIVHCVQNTFVFDTNQSITPSFSRNPHWAISASRIYFPEERSRTGELELMTCRTSRLQSARQLNDEDRRTIDKGWDELLSSPSL